MQEKDDSILTIRERVVVFLEKEGVSKSLFCKDLDISHANFSGVNLKSGLGSDIIVKIITRFPSISLEWLLLGKGSMTKAPNINHSIHNSNNKVIGSNIHLGKGNINSEITYSREDFEITALNKEIRTLRETNNSFKEQLKNKDVQMANKDEQLRSKDKQIDKLLSLLSSK